MNSKVNGLFFLVLLFMLAGCGLAPSKDNVADTQTITVFAASSLTAAFTELAAAFETQNPETAVLLNFAGSSQLAAQLRAGMEGDVFASANPVQMEAVIDAELIAANSETAFASNFLTAIMPADNPVGITTFEDLAKPDVQLILAGKGVPVRTYTDEIVAVMPPDFRTGFYNNLVSEEDNVRRVAAKIALGEADAGIVYATDITPDLATKVQQIEIPPDQNMAAVYVIAPLLDAPKPDLAAHFIDFVNGPEGQAILAAWGFRPPSGDTFSGN